MVPMILMSPSGMKAAILFIIAELGDMITYRAVLRPVARVAYHDTRAAL